MLTPRQRIFLDDPRLREIIERLELEPVASTEFKRGEAISERVDAWMGQIIASPSVPRETKKDPADRKPWDEVDLSGVAKGTAPF